MATTMRKEKRKRVRKRKAKPLAVVTSDNHLHPFTWADKPTLRNDAMFSFDQIVNYCLENDVPNLILAGDIMDRKKNDSYTPSYVRCVMDQLARNGVRVLYIQGQHELQTDGSAWLSALHDAPVHIHELEVSLGDWNMWGIDWTPASDIEAALSGVPEDTQILVMHQVCQEFMGRVRACELNIASVPHAELLIIGDYHAHISKSITASDGRALRALSPGSTCMQAIDEEFVKRFFVLFDDLSVTSVWLKTRPVLQFKSLLTQKAVDEFVESISGELFTASQQAHLNGISLDTGLTKPIVIVPYAADLEGAGPRIKKAVGENGFLFEKPKPFERSEREEDLLSREEVCNAMSKRGLSGLLNRVVDPKDEKELYHFCEELLEGDPREVIARWRSKFNLEE